MPSGQPGHHDADVLPPGRIVDRYVVEATLGIGGTAAVYRVRHRDLGTTYALKVLTVVSPSIRRRTLLEGRLQARIEHDNVVGVYDVLDVDGSPGLLMEIVDGPSLEAAMRKHRFTGEEAEIVFRGTCQGVAAAHTHGFVHRDLKPGNVLLAQTPSGLLPKVTDFGIAKVADADLGHTRAGIAMGTPQYMAPEQIRDARSVDQRADIFSLGCILYELATGQRAFPQADLLDVYNAIASGSYAHPRDLSDALPDRVVTAIRGALLVDRDHRIPDALTLLDVFEGRRGWAHHAPQPPPAHTPRPDAPLVAPGRTVLPLTLLTDLGPDDPTAAADLPTEEVRRPTLLAPTDAGPADAEPTGPDLPTTRADIEHTTPLTLGALHEPPEALLPNRRRLVLPTAALILLGLALWVRMLVPSAAPTPPAPAPASDAPETAASAAPSPEAEADVHEREPAPAASAVGAPEQPPAPSAPPRASQPTAAPTAPPSAPASRPTPPRAAAASHTVKLLSQPPTATLWVDGRQLGRTPHKLDLPAGRHTVQLRLTSTTASFPIDVSEGGENRWCFAFNPTLDSGTPHRGACP